MGMYDRPSCLTSAVTLFGAYCIAYVLSLFGHEGGHALVLLLTRGSLRDFYINPFGTSYVAFDRPPAQMVFTIFAGAFLGSLLGLIVWLLTLRTEGPFWLPLRLYGMIAPADNGSYLLLDAILGNGMGDGSRLLLYGVPLLAVVGFALLLLCLSLVMALHLQPAMGIDPADSFGRRLGILWGGFLPYLALGSFYSTAIPVDLLGGLRFWWSVLVVWGLYAFVGVLPFVIISWLIQVIFRWPNDRAQWNTGFHAYVMFVFGLGTVVITLYIFKR